MTPVETRDMDIIPEPRCGKNMDPDVALGSNQGPDTTMAPRQQCYQIRMAPAVASLSDTNMVSGVCPDSWHLHISRITGATDINLDPGFCWATDADMALFISPGPDNTMAL